MDTFFASKVTELVANLGLAAAKNHFREKINEQKLKSDLSSFIERQKKYNDICSLAEEIDFQGLVEYIQSNLLEAVKNRLFAPSSEERYRARQEIVDAAIACSKADTPEAKKRVADCIFNCIDIIRDFYCTQHLSIREYLFADLIVDPVVEKVDESTTSIKATVDNAKNVIVAKIDSIGSLFSLPRANALAEAGDYDAIETGFKKVLDCVSLEHPLYPYYGFDYTNGRIHSKPLIEEAMEKFPARCVFTGAIKVGNQYYNDPNGDPLDYSYRHQLPLYFEISTAVKKLGERLDPCQDEAQALIGKTLTAPPPEFPPPFPCAIKVGEKTFFDYVLFRTQEILDDGTYIIGNQEQSGSFHCEVIIDPRMPDNPSISFNLFDADNHELLNFEKFKRALLEEKDIHIYLLSRGEDYIAGNIKDINNERDYSSLEKEIDFLERVCAIEDHFGVVLNPRGEISNYDYGVVLYISDLIRNDEVTGTWSEMTVTGTLDKNFREKLIDMNENLFMFSYVGIYHVELFGAKFEFRFMRTFKCARMINIEKIKQKAQILDDGDSISISFRAGDDTDTIDTLKIPEKIEGTP